MQLSTRARYAVMAMTELACRECRDARPVALSDIAAKQQLSLCYLEQIFGGLRRAGLVTSARGPGGGYRLTRPAASVTVADILAAVDEPLRADHGDLWAELGRQIFLFLSAITLDDVVAGRVCGRAIAPPRRVEAA